MWHSDAQGLHFFCLVYSQNDIWLNLGTQTYLVRFWKWLVTLCFIQDIKYGLLGENRVCDPPLNPAIHPSRHFIALESTSYYVSVQVSFLLFESKKEITIWAQEHFLKHLLTLNRVCLKKNILNLCFTQPPHRFKLGLSVFAYSLLKKTKDYLWPM